MGPVCGMAVGRPDHIWVLQRSGLDTVDELGAAQTPPESQCCFAAPPVLVFDAQGNLLQSWGGPSEGFDWPKREHGIYVDKDDSVWISGAGPGDRQILKFKSDGHFLMQIGHPSTDPANSTRTAILGLPAADGENNVIWTLRREDGVIVGQTGHNGRNAGQFHWVHQIVSDSQGNLYTGEVDTGKRIQKFVLQH